MPNSDFEIENDVFLSHSSAEKPSVETIGDRLRRDGLRAFLDKWNLVPGKKWQVGLTEALNQSASVAIFFGPGGEGPWHNEEMQVALNKAVRSRNDYRIIPVLLPGADPSQIEGFLELRTWVDFRSGLDDEEAYRRLVAGIKGEPPDEPGYELPDEPRPYRGLEPFEADDHEFFFGRNEDIRRLIDRLRHDRFVAVVGASGSGKSSLVRAGLATEAAEQREPGIRQWQRIVLLPGNDPLRQLATSLVAHLPEAERPELVRRFVEDFRRGPEGLITALTTLFPNSEAPVLLLVDQFEELITHRPEGGEQRARWRERTACFAANLRAAFDAETDWLRIVVTLRAEFIGRFVSEDFPDIRALMERRQLWLGEMDEDDLREAIVLPAKRVGAFFEKGLVETLFRDVRDQPGSLPLLADVLNTLWRNRRGPWLTIDAYERCGGVAGALNQRAQDAYANRLKTDHQRAIAKDIFLRLTSLGEGTLDTRRRVPREDLYPKGVGREEVDRVLKQLADKDVRLIRAGQDTVEVTHEALIHNWHTLRKWLDDNRELLRQHHRLNQQAREWEKNNRRPEYLYRGGQLEDAEQWPQDPNVRLNDLEDEFLRASIEEREKQNRKATRTRRSLIGLTAAALLLAVGAVIFASLARSLAITARYQRVTEMMRTAKELSRRSPSEAEFVYWQAWEAANSEAWYAALPEDPRCRNLLNLIAAKGSRGWRLPHDDTVNSASFSPDGEQIVTASDDSTVRVWNAQSGELISEVKHDDRVVSASFSPDGERIVTASTDGTALVWDTESGEPITDPLKHGFEINSASFSPDGTRIVTASLDETAQVWDAHSGQPIGNPLQHDVPVTSASFSPDGTRIVTASILDETARVWDAKSGELISEMKHEAEVYSASFSPHGTRIVTASSNGTARVWDAHSGEPIGDPLKHDGSVRSASFGPDGQRIVTASIIDETARVWDAHSGEPIGDALQHDDSVRSASFSPDGQRIVTASGHISRGTARVWDTQSGESITDPLQHDAQVNSASFNPDGTRIVTASLDETARVWDAESGELISEMKHEAEVYSASFSPHGTRIVTASADGTARVWEVLPPSTDDEDWLKMSVRARTGFRLKQDGDRRDYRQQFDQREPIPIDEWLELRKKRFDPDRPPQRRGYGDVRTWDQVSDAEKQIISGK